MDSDPLRLVGAALSNWSLVEMQLARLFDTHSGISNQRKSYALFDAIVSFDVRLTLCDRLMAFESVNELELEMWGHLSKRLSKFYKKRHELAHFSAIMDDAGERFIGIKPFPTWTKFATDQERTLKAEDVRIRSQKFIELHMAVGWFVTQALGRRLSEPPVPSPTEQEPPLVPRLREAAIRSLEAKRSRP